MSVRISLPPSERQYTALRRRTVFVFCELARKEVVLSRDLPGSKFFGHFKPRDSICTCTTWPAGCSSSTRRRTGSESATTRTPAPLRFEGRVGKWREPEEAFDEA